MWKLFGVIVLLCVVHQGFGETGCPDPEDILPCVCTENEFTNLLCQNLTDAEELRNVFIHSERYSYNEVHIEYSILQFLPYDIFETVKVNELYLKNLSLSELFDKPPQALYELTKLQIENTKVIRGLIWKILEPLKGLSILNVYFTSIKTLGKEFCMYAPNFLDELTFYGTETKTIKPGAFQKFNFLNKLTFDACKLSTLTRDMFPAPYFGDVLNLNDNKITTIPEGLFKLMPNLLTLGLRKNLIATLPQEAFDSLDVVSKIEYLFLEDNPLKCDCLLVWLMDAKPKNLRGKCTSPKRLQGRDLKDLARTNFNC